MEEKRIPVYGADGENKQKRAFDWVQHDGKLYVETKDRYGHVVKTSAAQAIKAYRKLKEHEA